MGMGMGMKVFGKSDKYWVTLMLWMDDKCPEFCPVCLLLIQIYIAKIKGGFFSQPKLNLTIHPLMVFCCTGFIWCHERVCDLTS